MADTGPTDPARDYLLGWAAMTKLMHDGHSWSGHERNCAYLNLGSGEFADVSFAAGLDFLDDGRATAVADWDGDGDLDVWLKNRTGPQLRFMRNDGPRDGSSFLALKLVGRSCNRDAVGAKVTVRCGVRSMTRVVLAGDGYLAQSSKWLHFALPDGQAVDECAVRWPDGKRQSLNGLAAGGFYLVEQGEPARRIEARTAPGLMPEPAEVTDAPPLARIVLKVPLPLPPSVLSELGYGPQAGRPLWVGLWAQWCAPCIKELRELLSEGDSLGETGLDRLAVNVDQPADRGAAQRVFGEKILQDHAATSLREQAASPRLLDILTAVLDHVRDKKESWPLPTSMLIDARGELQVIYLGPVTVSQLAADAEMFGRDPPPLHRRGAFAGRWFYGIPRDLLALSRELKERGYRDEGVFYVMADRLRNPIGRGPPDSP